MYNIFLNNENDIFNYSENELKEYDENFYIAKDNIFIPKTIVTKVLEVEEIPEDYEDGKYKYINDEFVLNDTFQNEEIQNSEI